MLSFQEMGKKTPNDSSGPSGGTPLRLASLSSLSFPICRASRPFPKPNLKLRRVRLFFNFFYFLLPFLIAVSHSTWTPSSSPLAVQISGPISSTSPCLPFSLNLSLPPLIIRWCACSRCQQTRIQKAEGCCTLQPPVSRVSLCSSPSHCPTPDASLPKLRIPRRLFATGLVGYESFPWRWLSLILSLLVAIPVIYLFIWIDPPTTRLSPFPFCLSQPSPNTAFALPKLYCAMTTPL
jgi:hypothetical protein